MNTKIDKATTAKPADDAKDSNVSRRNMLLAGSTLAAARWQ